MTTSKGSNEELINLLRNLRGLNTSFSSQVALCLSKDPFVPFTGLFDEYLNHLSKIVKDNSKAIEALKSLEDSDPLKVLNGALTSFVTDSKDGTAPISTTSPEKAPAKEPAVAAPAPVKPASTGGSLFSGMTSASTGVPSTGLFKPATSVTTVTAPPAVATNFSFGGFGTASKPADMATSAPAAPLFGSLNSGSTFSFAQPAATSLTKPAEAIGGDDEGDDDIVQEEQIDTEKLMRGAGEDAEETLMEVRTKAFKFDKEKKGWQDIGVGIIKINKDNNTERARLLLRADGSGRVLLNTYIVSGMDSQLQNEKAICFMSVLDGAPTKILLRVKEASDASKFLNEVKKFEK
jgi:nucleoporin NUP2